MKKIILFLFFFSLIIIQAQTKNLFTYELIRNEKFQRKISKKFEGLVKVNNSEFEYKYAIVDNRHHFYPILKIDNSQVNGVDLSQSFIKSNGEYFIINDTVYNVKSFIEKKYGVISTFKDYNWKHTLEEKMINGTLCKKSYLSKQEESFTKNYEYEITVWSDANYEDNINPFGLIGIKGLVKEMNFNNRFSLKLKYSEDVEDLKDILLPQKLKRVTINEFDEIVAEFKLKFKKYRERLLDN